MSSADFTITLEPTLNQAREQGFDLGYEEGHRAALRAQLQAALIALLGHRAAADDPLVTVARLTLERDDARAALRQVCKVYGDNDWPDELRLRDVIEKHLHARLDEAQGD